MAGARLMPVGLPRMHCLLLYANETSELSLAESKIDPPLADVLADSVRVAGIALWRRFPSSQVDCCTGQQYTIA